MRSWVVGRGLYQVVCGMQPDTPILFEDICLVAYLEGRYGSSFVAKRAKRIHDEDSEFVHTMLSASILNVVSCPWCSQTW